MSAPAEYRAAPGPLTDCSRLCLHTATTKPWALDEAILRYAAAGVKGVTVWRDTLAGRDAASAGRLIRDAGLSIVSLCRGGFFPALTAASRQRAIDENRRCIDEAALLGAPLIVIVAGSTPGQSLVDSRRQIRDGIAAVLPHAAAAKVKLALEPLHPIFAADRSAINTLAQARQICTELGSPWLGITVDVYHVWWDPQLEQEIRLAGRAGLIAAFHISDWRSAVGDMLNDRGLMGEGCIPIRQIRGWVEETGFRGFHEVEIFSDRYWSTDQSAFLHQIKAAYLAHG